MIQHPLEIPRAIHEAFHIARTGRPGPVVVDIPVDLSRADIPYEPVTDVHLPGYQPTTDGNPKQIRQAAKALAAARRPVIYAGGGVVNAERVARSCAELATAGPLPGHLHADGPRRVPGAARAVARHARHARHARGELRDGRGRPHRRGRRALRRPHHRQALASSRRGRSSSTSTSTRPRSPRTSRRTSRSSATRGTSSASSSVEYRALEADGARLEEWWQRIDAWQRAATRCATRTPSDAEIKPAADGRGALRGDRRRRDRHLRRRPAPDVGGAVLPLQPAAPLDQLAAAWGRWASACRPRWAPRSAARTRLVVCIAGDGSVQMNMQELATCAQDGIAIKVFIMNNGYLGMVRQWQELFWDKRYSHVDMGEWPGLRQARRGLRGDRHAARPTRSTLVDDLRGGARDGRPGPGRRARHAARRTCTR